MYVGITIIILGCPHYSSSPPSYSMKHLCNSHPLLPHQHRAKWHQQQGPDLTSLPHINCYLCCDGGRSGVLVVLRLPHPPWSSIYFPLLPPHVPLPGKVYVVSHHLCHLCPPLGGSIVGGIPPPQNTKHNASLSSLHPPSSLPEPAPPFPSSNNSRRTVTLCRLCCHLPTPAYGWLLCVGRMALDIIDVVINIFISSPLDPLVAITSLTPTIC